MSRRHVPHLTLAALGLLTVGALALSVRTDSSATFHPSNKGNPYGAPSYGFGGYTLFAKTTEIGARWRVPTILPDSSNGNATTWIAVEDTERQFIQLGTTENKQNGVDSYGIFWSDVTVDFHPQQLLDVEPGDLIAFTMRQTSGGWRLSFDDRTDAATESITVPYARGAHFNLGQWIQEDPTVGGLSQHLPYPSMTAPTFSHLTLDSAEPSLHEDEAQVLSTAKGVYLVPSPVTHDEFTLRDPTGAQRQYLDDIFAFNAANFAFQVDLFYNRAPSSSTLRAMIAGMSALHHDLDVQTWPADLASPIKADVKVTTRLVKLFRTFPHAPQELNSGALAELSSVDEQSAPITERVRRLLDLPPAS